MHVASAPPRLPRSRLSPSAALAIRAAIRLAGGREVCFVCTLDSDGVFRRRASSRAATSSSVLALPGFANRGEMLVHNHPSGAARAVRAGPGRRGAHPRRRHRLRHRQQRRRPTCTSSSKCRRAPRFRALARSRIDRSDLGPDGGVAAEHARYEDRPSQRAMAVRDRAAVQRRRRRAARGGNGRRQVARLSRSGAALGGGERRAHGRVDEHDQPPGAARRARTCRFSSAR